MSMPSRTLAPEPVRNTRRVAAGAPARKPIGNAAKREDFPTWLAMIMMIPVALYALLVIPGASLLVVVAWAGVVGIVWAARNYSRAAENERTRIRGDRPRRVEPQATLRPVRRARA